MNIKHKDLDIPVDNPFLNCKLGRSKNAEVLTTIVNTYGDGFVLAINNKWGTGKTTFIKMWRQQLDNTEYKTLYFNAWENDFESSPLIALMGELRTLIPPLSSKKTFNVLTQKAGVLAKNILPALAGAIASKYLDLEDIKELIKKTTEAGAEILTDEIEKYSTKKNGLIEFRKTLTDFIAELKTDKPIVFIIDELDRCRPNYAVEVLENIKHFFNVPNVIFVLSIDKEQLSHAIKGVYGSENLDTTEYLRRFIDIEYQIPDPDTKSFCSYLFDYYEFKTFLKSDQRLNTNAFRNDASNFLMVATALFTKERVTLRQQEQIFAYARIALNAFGNNMYVFPELLLLLIYLKITNSGLYSKINCRVLSVEELNNELNEVLPYFNETENINNVFMFDQAEIVYRYNKSIESRESSSIIRKDKTTGNEIFILRSKYDHSSEGSDYKRAFESFTKSWDLERIGIDYILNKINLIDNIII